MSIFPKLLVVYMATLPHQQYTRYNFQISLLITQSTKIYNWIKHEGKWNTAIIFIIVILPVHLHAIRKGCLLVCQPKYAIYTTYKASPSQNLLKDIMKYFIHLVLHVTAKLSNLITVQQDATYSVYYISVGSSTCFGCWHPSSGVRTTVITASGID